MAETDEDVVIEVKLGPDFAAMVDDMKRSEFVQSLQRQVEAKQLRSFRLILIDPNGTQIVIKHSKTAPSDLSKHMQEVVSHER